MKMLPPVLTLLFLILASAVSPAAPEGPGVRWVEDDEAVVERTLKDGTVEQAGPEGICVIQVPAKWKVVIEVEFNHANFIKPVIAVPIEWSNPHPAPSEVTLDFQNWVQFRDAGASVKNRYTLKFGNETVRHDLPGKLFNVAHDEKCHCHPFPGFKPGQGRVLLLDCQKTLRDRQDPFFWFKIYLKFVPPSDTI